jgi:tripartite-type tricarboxylate transporter receptor subunit TctC
MHPTRQRRTELRAAILLLSTIGLLAPGALAPDAHAQDWPQRRVRIVVGFGPGSTPDLMARMVAERLQPRLGQPFVVENKAGAGGNIAADAVAKAAPDGHTLGATIPGPLVVNPMTMDLPYNPKTDLAPITIVGTQPSVLIAGAGVGAATLADLVAVLKKNPGRYNYASVGIGTISHLAMEMIAQASGTEVVHVPYKASPEAVQAVIAGEAHMAALPPLAVLSHAQAGRVRMLAVTTPVRWPALPDVPTFKEAGLPEVQAEAWMALVAPARTPAAIIERIHREVKAILALPETREQVNKLAFQPVGNSPAEFAAVLREEEARWAKVVERAGLRKPKAN